MVTVIRSYQVHAIHLFDNAQCEDTLFLLEMAHLESLAVPVKLLIKEEL